MRVLLDISAVPARPVGAGVYTVALARGLAERDDIELHLVARRDDADRWGEIAPGARVHAEVPGRRPLRLAWEQTRGRALARRDVCADVWHGPHYTMPLSVGVPAVVTMHDMTFFDHPEWHERTKVAYFRRMIRASAARARVVMCDSEFTAARLRAHVRPTGATTVVPLGVDLRRFTSAEETRRRDLAQLAAHGIEPPYIAFAGTLEPRKNVPALIAAFARIATRRSDVRLVIAGGDGWGAEAVRAAIATSGVATRIVRTGYLDDDTLVALLRRAEVVAYPSFEEGFGLPALETLACGTPLVTSTGSALAEVAGDAALLVEPTDADALSAALTSVLDDEQLAGALGDAGPRRAAEFTWDRCVIGCVNAYEQATRDRVRMSERREAGIPPSSERGRAARRRSSQERKT